MTAPSKGPQHPDGCPQWPDGKHRYYRDNGACECGARKGKSK
jgi:hypothetical protein